MLTSSGILLFKIVDKQLYIFLEHPGGPFFINKDKGFWGIPKGLVESEDSNLFETAKRELFEETGAIIENTEYIDLGYTIFKSKKKVYCFAIESDLQEGYAFKSNTFKLEYPINSGKFHEYPEVDNAKFFLIKDIKENIRADQMIFIDRLLRIIKPRLVVDK